MENSNTIGDDIDDSNHDADDENDLIDDLKGVWNAGHYLDSAWRGVENDEPDDLDNDNKALAESNEDEVYESCTSEVDLQNPPNSGDEDSREEGTDNNNRIGLNEDESKKKIRLIS